MKIFYLFPQALIFLLTTASQHIVLKSTPASPFQLFKRQVGYGPEYGDCEIGTTCEESCGSDFQQCAASTDLVLFCFNPSAGQTCCEDGNGRSHTLRLRPLLQPPRASRNLTYAISILVFLVFLFFLFFLGLPVFFNHNAHHLTTPLPPYHNTNTAVSTANKHHNNSRVHGCSHDRQERHERSVFWDAGGRNHGVDVIRNG
ncbi:hypothetical protein M011DRAFT_499362 [Sporormia fimetaria CBS 119925]|uniref:Uncharacterized protein n=1 Tax=Sporormia fimetaria CBS 119925 TaxID=1340428 RepID=A0A6A6VDB9_9PLEO|nr:hypothetical protein M011DRAFT_499362 [Sporormia fimetaria CBS 119925]